jgi:hypothetical protein
VAQPLMAVHMRKQRPHKISALGEQLRRERELATARLTPAERLRDALDLSDLCLKLAAKGRELRATSSSPQNHKRS